MRKLSIAAFAVVLVLTPVGASAQPRQANLPDGVGKDLVEGLCTGCHSANQIVRSSGYTEEEWAEHFSNMVDLADMPKERSEIARYLAANMPPDTTRAPTLVPGELEVGFTEWKVPALGQRARDPVEAPDGTIWWAGQWGNLIGRIDPTTGEMKEYPLPADAMPHSVTIDDAGMVWYTGNQNGSVGKFDPTTGGDHRLSDAQSRGPRPAHRSVRRRRDPVVHVAAEQYGQSPRSSDRRGSPCDGADRAGAPLPRLRQLSVKKAIGH